MGQDKGPLQELGDLLQSNPNALPRKRLEEIRGYFVHIAQTYPMFSCYLIGLHMTIDGWRPNRDGEGWRYSDSQVQSLRDEGLWPLDYDYRLAPKTVKAVDRLLNDVEALKALTQGDLPMLRRVRGRKTGQVLYGFGDASLPAFGATVQLQDRLLYRYGEWSQEIREDSTSNWRELANLVNYLKYLAEQESLAGYEIFMFTDNSTAESAYWKGTSTSRKLFDLVLELKRLELEQDLILHVTHVSGKRMIAQGTDGLSRADHTQGVMLGQPIQAFVPLHQSPLDREPKLEGWLRTITDDLNPFLLSPEDWYTTGHSKGTFIWAPPPAAAEVVVEQLGRARLKRPEAMHIVVVPRVMTGRWRRALSRGSEFYFRIDRPEVWDVRLHFEPLLLFVCLPYRSHDPKLDQQEELLVKFRRALLGPNLSQTSEERLRYILRKLLRKARELCPL